MIETSPHKKQERALLIGLEKEGVSKWDLRDSMEVARVGELSRAEVVDTVTQNCSQYALLSGGGGMTRIPCKIDVTSVIFNDVLPGPGT